MNRFTKALAVFMSSIFCGFLVQAMIRDVIQPSPQELKRHIALYILETLLGYDFSIDTHIKTGLKPVSTVAFSSDGSKALLAVSGSLAPSFWDLKREIPLKPFVGKTKGIWSVELSPDGSKAVTGSHDTTVRLWNTASGHEIRAFNGHNGVVYAVAFSTDETKLLTGSQDKTALLWDIQTGQILQSFRGHTAALLSVALSPDGTTALTAAFDKTACLWDVNTGQKLLTVQEPSASTFGVFSPDGKTILTGGFSKNAHMWNSTTGELLMSFIGHTEPLFAGGFSPDGKTIVTGSSDRTVRLWDSNSGEQLATLPASDIVLKVLFTKDGISLVTGTGDGTIAVWKRIESTKDWLAKRARSAHELFKERELATVLTH